MTLSVGFYDSSLKRYRLVYVLCTVVSNARHHGRMRTIADTCTPGLAAYTSSSNMPASTLSAHSKKHRVSTTNKTWRQISKPEQPNGTPHVALQHCVVSCRRMHSCHSKTLKHAAHLETRLTLQAVHT